MQRGYSVCQYVPLCDRALIATGSHGHNALNCMTSLNEPAKTILPEFTAEMCNLITVFMDQLPQDAMYALLNHVPHGTRQPCGPV